MAANRRSGSTTTAIGSPPGVVGWSDVGAFLARLDHTRSATKRTAMLHLQEEARTLYRGEYLDDCPFYGDSAYVEDRRTALRSRFVDLLVTLGEAYEAGGDRASAASAFREAEQLRPMAARRPKSGSLGWHHGADSRPSGIGRRLETDRSSTAVRPQGPPVMVVATRWPPCRPRSCMRGTGHAPED